VRHQRDLRPHTARARTVAGAESVLRPGEAGARRRVPRAARDARTPRSSPG
jgi:hypothetical protein